MPGVERKRLERLEAESGHATSLVRYAPDSRFRSHTHTGGEEFIVLHGVFSDDSGDFGPLTYVRNQVGSAHAPFSEGGCTIFVKLHQMSASESPQVTVEFRDDQEARTLYKDDAEHVQLRSLRADCSIEFVGVEILVLSGTVIASGALAGEFAAPSWIRVPTSAPVELRATESTLLWTKSGHLP
ncbi:MAG: hypothetical protein ACJAYU_000681 [Bradymonadia bacterium]|jgi:hypothetical protein